MEITKTSDYPVEPTDKARRSSEPPDGGPAEPPIGWADALGPDVENPPTARTHGRQLIEPDGTTHAVSTCENRIKGQFELWVQNNALRCVAHAESSGNPDMASKLMSAYVGDWGANEYSWNGKYVRQAIVGEPGFLYLLYLLMARCDPKKTEEQVRKLARKYTRQCAELINWALGNSQSPAETGANGTKTKTTDLG